MDPSIPIPRRLQKRPKFNGIPIPFTAFVRPDKTPDFKVTDQRSWTTCMLTKRCGLCGEKLLKGEMFFIGGPLSCESGVFYDPPMHRECAEYAFKVCPFLAAQKEYSKKPVKPIEGVTIVTDHSMPTQRPDKMGILFTKDFHMVRDHLGGLKFKAVKIESVEWKD